MEKFSYILFLFVECRHEITDRKIHALFFNQVREYFGRKLKLRNLKYNFPLLYTRVICHEFLHESSMFTDTC